MVQNTHTPEVQTILARGMQSWISDQAAAERVDYSNINYASLPFAKEGSRKSVWYLSVHKDSMSMLDSSGNADDAETPDSQSEYTIFVSNMDVPHYFCDSVGPPDSQSILR